jgi:hypothetical protein
LKSTGISFSTIIRWVHNWTLQPDSSVITAYSITDEIRKAMMRRGMVAQSLYAIGALLCLVDTYLSITVLIIIQLYFVLGLFSKSPVRRVIKNH